MDGMPLAQNEFDLAYSLKAIMHVLNKSADPDVDVSLVIEPEILESKN